MLSAVQRPPHRELTALSEHHHPADYTAPHAARLPLPDQRTFTEQQNSSKRGNFELSPIKPDGSSQGKERPLNAGVRV